MCMCCLSRQRRCQILSVGAFVAYHSLGHRLAGGGGWGGGSLFLQTIGWTDTLKFKCTIKSYSEAQGWSLKYNHIKSIKVKMYCHLKKVTKHLEQFNRLSYALYILIIIQHLHTFYPVSCRKDHLVYIGSPFSWLSVINCLSCITSLCQVLEYADFVRLLLDWNVSYGSEGRRNTNNTHEKCFRRDVGLSWTLNES